MEKVQQLGNGPRTRRERAAHVRDMLVDIVHRQGDWSETPTDHKEPVRRCGSFVGLGVTALHSLTEPDEDLIKAALAQSGGEMVMFALDDLLDVWVDGVGKVLSVRDGFKGIDLITIIPGPWEAAFGLPERQWPSSVARRLEAARPVISAMAA